MTDGSPQDFAGSLLRAIANQFGVEPKRSRGRPRKPVLTKGVKTLANLRTRGRTKSDRPEGRQEEDDSGALAIVVAVLLRDASSDLGSFPARTRATELAALRIFGMDKKMTFSTIRKEAPEDGPEHEMLKLQARLAKKLHPKYALQKDDDGQPVLHPDIFSGADLGEGIIGHPLMKLPAEERRAVLESAIDMLVKAERERLGLAQ